jgi:hypothetical protein
MYTAVDKQRASFVFWFEVSQVRKKQNEHSVLRWWVNSFKVLWNIHPLLGNDCKLQQSNGSVNNGRCQLIATTITLASIKELLEWFSLCGLCTGYEMRRLSQLKVYWVGWPSVGVALGYFGNHLHHWKPLPEDWWWHSGLRILIACCSELHSVNILNSCYYLYL